MTQATPTFLGSKMLMCLLALVIVATACSSSTEDPATPTTLSVVTATTRTTITPPPTGVPGPRSYPAGVRTEVFTDLTRETPSSGSDPASPERVLETVIHYPSSDDGESPSAFGPFPLIVFSHGLGGTPEFHAAMLSSWAESGFVVAAPRFPRSRPDNPGGPDAGDVVNQTGDVSFLIDTITSLSADPDSWLSHMIDPKRIGAAGHSNGAITTIGATLHECCADDRIGAAIEFAGTAGPFPGGDYDWSLAPPFLIVHGTDDVLISYANAIELYNNLDGPKGLLTLEGGDHSGMFSPQSRDFDRTVAATTTFWQAMLLDQAEPLGRLGSDPLTDLRWADQGVADSITTTTVPGLDRQASADQLTGVTDGQLVTISWSGFIPGGSVNVVQCSARNEGAGFCDLARGRILLPNPTGSGSVEIELFTGPIGEGTCSAAQNDCFVVVNDSGLTEPDATVNLPIEFAAS